MISPGRCSVYVFREDAKKTLPAELNGYQNASKYCNRIIAESIGVKSFFDSLPIDASDDEVRQSLNTMLNTCQNCPHVRSCCAFERYKEIKKALPPLTTHA